MSFVRTLNKILISSIFTVFLVGFFVPTAYADFWGDLGQKLFDTGEQGLSFTEYTGTLAQLDPKGYDQSLVSSSDLKEYVLTIVEFALGFLGLIAVLMIIYGGVLYVTAAGEDEKAGKAKKIIGFTTIGLLIVMGSYAFVNTVIKGASGGGEDGIGSGTTAITATTGFNASAEQVKSLAVHILNGFAFLAEVTEDLKNIQNDIQKESLTPTNFPAKGDALAFLNSVGSKLQNTKSNLQPFTVAEARINDLLRELDKDIDLLAGLSEKRFMKITDSAGGKAEYCDVGEERSFWEGAIGASDEEICNDAGYPYYYIENFFESWTKIYKKYNSANGAFYNDIVKPVAQSYYTDLQRIFGELEEIFDGFKNIEAIGSLNSRANGAHTQMKDNAGFGYNASFSNGGYKINPNTNDDGVGLLKEVYDWNINSKVDAVGARLIYGLKQQSILYEELKKLEFVQARLTADTIEGSAPLTVTFNALSTVDPAGGSIQGDHIIWDLAGTQTVDSLSNDPDIYKDTADLIGGNMLMPVDGSVDCTMSLGVGQTEEEFIGKTSKRCVYSRPGTYTAAVKINSNNPSKYAPGISVLTLKVRPPTTKIELTVKASAETESHIVSHYEDDVLLIDERTVQVTANDAKNGVTFDAKETDAKQYKWDYGDGEVTDFSDANKSVDHEYKDPGKYQVTLEVLSTLNVKDRKIFTLEISSVAAKLKAKPSEGSFINDSVIFDASGSRSDLGKITNYKWTIKPAPGQFIPASLQNQFNQEYPYTQEGGNLKILTHIFKYPLNYDINIEVRDDAQNTATADISGYVVKSQPPVARFESKNTDRTQPGTFTFDGSKSYDPDGGKDFSYAWSITPATDWEIVPKVNSSTTGKQPIVKFKKTGDYEVTLTVTDNINSGESSSISKTVKVESILDIAWDPKQQVTGTLDENGRAEIEFKLVSTNGKTYDINFGDGETMSGNLGEDEIVHTYNQTGKFNVKASIFDSEDNENTIERRIFISGGENPIAKARIYINGDEVQDLSQGIRVSKKDVVTFDAGDSRNAKGDTKNLKYSWDFGDNKNSSKIKTTHIYKELSPQDPGYYEVKLTVYDSQNPEKTSEDEAEIEVVNLPPVFSSVQGTPQPVDNTLVTPVTAVMKVFGSEDPDGEIVKYKWWYFDTKNSEEQLGIQITNVPTARLTIGTRGKQGEEVSYGFGLEISDSDGLVYSNEEAIASGQISKLDVTNGANALPVAKFSVSSTSVFAGDKVTFTSTSTDPDGPIKEYIWDFDGDGFFNDEPTGEASVSHTYTSMNKAGIDVRLKVVDDKGGESISTPIKIYIDSLAKPPTAGFTFESIPGSDGMKIKFTNTSTADEKAGAEILSSEWDYDTDSKLLNADSNGDGKKDNDIDSRAKNPERLYTEKGDYKVKLTITDNQGNRDEVINSLKLPLANPPLAAFTYELKEGKVLFNNTSATDIKSGSIITKYLWDFDLNIDSDGDGKKDNDGDSQLKDPAYSYPKPGTYKVKLTVVDNQGGSDDVISDVSFSGSQADAGGPPSGGSENATGSANLQAVMTLDTLPAADGYLYLSGTSGMVKIDFSKSAGAIQYYSIDKNIYFDTDGNGNKTDDADFKTALPGAWTTNFDKSWGKIAMKLTVTDIYGNLHSATQEIKFK